MVYTLQIERMDRLDDLYMHAQYVSRVEPQDRQFGVYRDAFDSDLLAPVGAQAQYEQDLLRDLRGE